VARSAEVLVGKRQLPVLDGRGKPRRERFEAYTDFAVYLAMTMVADRPSLARAGAVAWMAERLARKLVQMRATRELIAQARQAVHAIAPMALRGWRLHVASKRPAPKGTEPKTREAAERRTKPRREPPAGQGDLF
jgi:hypothetical protein